MPCCGVDTVVDTQVWIPVWIDGDWRIWVVPDRYNLIGEWDPADESGDDDNIDENEDNNVAPNHDASDWFEVPGKPDMALTDLESSVGTVAPGDELPVYYRVHNLGGLNSPATRVHIYLSPTEEYDPATAVEIFEGAVPPLNPNGDWTDETVDVVIPDGTVPGDYFLVGNVEPVAAEVFLANNDGTALLSCPGDALCGDWEQLKDGIGDEDLEAENGEYALDNADTTDLADLVTIASSPTVDLAMFDMTVTGQGAAVSAEAIKAFEAQLGVSENGAMAAAMVSVVPGGTLTVDYVITNYGMLESPPSSVNAYMSEDAVLDQAADQLLGDAIVPEIAPGAFRYDDLDVTVPAGTPPGDYFLFLMVDPDDLIPESNEGNNEISEQFPVTPAEAPDLTVPVLIPQQTSGLAGDNVQVDYGVQNIGNAVSTLTSLNVYLSGDTVWDSGDALIGGAVIPAIDPGAGETGVVTVQIPPATTPGDYHMIGVIDPDGLVNESNESNNERAAAFTVGTVAIPPVLDAKWIESIGGLLGVVGITDVGSYGGQVADHAVWINTPWGQLYTLVPGTGWVAAADPFLFNFTVQMGMYQVIQAPLTSLPPGLYVLSVGVDLDGDGILSPVATDYYVR